MDRKTSVSHSDRQRTRTNSWGQNNAAEHNDTRSVCINTGRRGPCDCRAVRPFCLPRSLCSGTEAERLHARFALALSARTTGERFETVLRRILRSLAKFAQSLLFEFSRKPGAGLESRLGLSDWYQRQKLRGSQLPSSGRISNFFRSNRSKWIAHGVLSMFLV